MGIFGKKTIDMTKPLSQKNNENININQKKIPKNEDKELTLSFIYIPPNFNDGQFREYYNLLETEERLSKGNSLDKILVKALKLEYGYKEEENLGPMKINYSATAEGYRVYLDVTWKSSETEKMLDYIFNSGSLATPEFVPFNKHFMEDLNSYFEKKGNNLRAEYYCVGGNGFGKLTESIKFYRIKK
jgi:hypothetical protein